MIKSITLSEKAVLITAALSLYFFSFPIKTDNRETIKLWLIPYNEMPEPKNRKDSILMTDETGKKYLLNFSTGIYMDCEHYLKPLQNLTNVLDPYYE